MISYDNNKHGDERPRLNRQPIAACVIMARLLKTPIVQEYSSAIGVIEISR
jgi:hypothetical protein